ncbi:XRE family transcriptional regulator [Candidatus Sororendozoicomonas aggregata]|uniref:helix-turn-helix domain-containing protein n=1 Tax=Candidatus Sororendozoicomonas aggregata TaxID=3073239 RepID=UPI002ED2CD94
MFAERLKRARTGAKLSLRAMGEKLEISQTAVHKFEQGKLVPESSLLIKWAKCTGVRLEYFFRPESCELKDVEFRKRTTLPKKVEASIQADVLDQIERRLELNNLFPEPPVSHFKPPAASRVIKTLDDVEAVAEHVRDIWQLGTNAIPDLIDVLENQGILVFVNDCDDKRFDGLSGTVEGMPVVVVSSQWPGDRQRFTLAHELGHLILHDQLPETIDEEYACNRFAGAFLAPKASVQAMIGERRTGLELRELLFMKREFGLSMAASLYRCADLAIIGKGQKKSLFIRMTQLGLRKQEPEPLKHETPSLFKHLVYRALGEQFIGESKAAELLGMPVSRFHQLRMMGDQDAAAVRHQR